MNIVHPAHSAPAGRTHTSSRSMFSVRTKLAVAALACVAGSALAQRIVVDQFTQSYTDLAGQQGGRGFLGSWQNMSISLVAAPDGLSYTDPGSGIELATSAGRAANFYGPTFPHHIYRDWGFSAFPSGTPFWGSVLVRGPQNFGQWGSAYVRLQGPSNLPVRVGLSSSVIEIITPFGSVPVESVNPSDTTLLLFRISSQPGGGGPVSVWVNPPLTGELPPPSGTLQSVDLGANGPSGVSLEAIGAECSLDELRFGPSAESVLPRQRVTWSCSNGGNGHQYETVVASAPMSWADAAADSQARGGQLVTLTSAAENQLVFDNLVAREDIWDRQFGDLFFVDTRGPWIGASRPSYFPTPLDGWEWNSSEAWGFTAWSPQGLVGSGERYASFYMATDQATPTWRSASLNEGRIRSYVVEYEPGFVQQPQDVNFVDGMTVVFSASTSGAASSYRWFHNGVQLTDGPSPTGSVIQGATSSSLEIYYATLGDLGAYTLQAQTDCGMFESRTAYLRTDAINAGVVNPGNCSILRIVPLASPDSWTVALTDAWSRGGDLISIESTDQQLLVDAMTLHPQLWQTNTLGREVGPWIGASFDATLEQWYWRSSFSFDESGYFNWAPGQPDNADGAETVAHLTRETSSGSTQWADLAEANPVGGTLPNSYIIEWRSPFQNTYQYSPVECGGEVIFDSLPVDHGLSGNYIWMGPDLMPVVDGVTPNGTLIIGQGTPTLHISNLAEADAGPYDLAFDSGCRWYANFLLQAIGCAAPCPADFNQDGGVDGSDVDAFFAAWESGDASADVNQDGGVDGSDIGTFFVAWENGGC